MNKKAVFLIAFLNILSFTNAQDLRSGEITYQYVSGFNYGARVVIYTQISTSVNRPYIIINWDEGTETLYTSPPVIVASDIYKYTYVANHVYSGSGTYNITVDESNLVSGISNIPNSENQNLHLHSVLNINPNFSGNNSPVFMNPQPLQWNCCNWVYDLSGYDVDGDSLSYSLIPCNDIGYIFPNATIDSITGQFHLFPDSIGRYALNIQVDEWRHNVKIGSLERVLLIDVNSLSSVSELSEDLIISIYPNPSSSTITINCPSNSPAYSLSIKDAIGREVKEDKLPANTIKKEVDVSALARGVYFVEVASGNKVSRERFVKQ